MQNRIIEKINIYNLKDKWQKMEIKIKNGWLDEVEMIR